MVLMPDNSIILLCGSCTNGDADDGRAGWMMDMASQFEEMVIAWII